MNKKTLRIAGWALGLSMAVAGIGAVAQLSAKAPIETKATEEIYKTALFGGSYNSGSVQNYTSTWSATNNGFTVNLENFNNNQNKWDVVKCGRKNYASTGTIITDDAIDEPITKVTVTIDAITDESVTSITLYTSTDGSSWNSAGAYTKGAGAQSVNLETPTANMYYKLECVCASGSANGLVTISRIDYYYNSSVSVESVSLNETSKSMYVDGPDFQLEATVAPANATNKNVTWSSSNPAVASVDENGLVHAEAEGGPVTITATTEDGSKTAECTVVVTAGVVSVTGVTIKESTTITRGETETLVPVIAPANATNTNVTWSTSNADVATVDENGVVTAVAVGSATITVTTEDQGLMDTCAVTVAPIAVASVSLDKSELNLIEGLTGSLTATVLPANADDKAVSWTSDKPSVATVSSEGVVTAVAPGSATITVTTHDGSKTATCAVTVVAKSVASIVITTQPTKKTYGVGEEIDLSGLKFTANYNNSTSTANLTDLAEGLTCSQTERFTKSDLGEQTITLTYGGKTATFTVTVSNSVVADQYYGGVDTLNRASTGITGTNYDDWSDVTGKSGAVYAGQSAGGNGSIQLRSSNSNSGIIVTASAGNVAKVTLVWNSNTTSGRTVDVYGKDAPYSSAADLYNNTDQGTKLGSIVYGTSTELTVTGDYAYIGIRSNSGALYLTSVTVDWGEKAKQSSKTPSASVIEEADDFVADNMGFDSISISDVTQGTTCVDPNFATSGVLKKFNDLSDNAKLVITSSTSTYDYVNGNLVTYRDVLNRLVAWADANGYNYADGVFTAKGGLGGLGVFALGSADVNGGLPIVLTLVSVGALTAGGLFLIRRRREED